MAFAVEDLVQLDEVVLIVVIEYNNAFVVVRSEINISLHIVNGGVSCNANIDVGIEVFQLGEGCLGS